jgi:hypothetical protein
MLHGALESASPNAKGNSPVRRLIPLIIIASAVTPLALASNVKRPAVTIQYSKSSCLQLPLSDTGKVRFFIRFVNHTSRTATFGKQIKFLWLRPDGWKESWLNTIEGTDPVPASRSKTYWVEFGADPTKLILRCALRIEGDERLHHVKVLR